MRSSGPGASGFAIAPAFLSVLVVTCAACGEAAPPAHGGGDPSAAAGGSLRRGVVPLAFEAKHTGSKPFPFAFVEGKIGRVATRFIIDSGAAAHAIDSSVASSAALAAPANATSLSIDGWGPLPAHAVAIRELPAAIRAHGIGGVVSPQLLAEGGQAVVVDFVNHQMRLSPKSTAWSAMEDVGAVLTPAAQRKPCVAEADGVSGLAIAVDGTIDGAAIRLGVDSGAGRTLIVEGSKGGAKAAAHPVLGRTMATTASSEVATSLYGGVPMTFGAWSSTVDVGVTTPDRAPQCGSEGRLGMDVLRDCALALTADEFLVSCRGGRATP